MAKESSDGPPLFGTIYLGPTMRSRIDILHLKCQQVVKPNPGLKFFGCLQYKLVPRVTEVELSFSFDARLYQQI